MENGFLVRVSIGLWTARKLDKNATREAKERAGASSRAGVKLYKTVLAADALDNIESIANAARAEHRKRTVPWSYDGPGAITVAGYPAYKAAMIGYEKQFNHAVEKFVAEYERDRHDLLTNVSNSMRVGLGKLFNPNDYPAVPELARKFSFTLSVEPIAEANHFHAPLPVEEVEEIRQGIIENKAQALDNANNTAWGRVIEHVEKLKLRLEGYKPANNGQPVEGKFHDSLIANITELAGLIPSINIANDPDLARMGQRLIALTAYTAQDLRESSSLRAEIARDAGAVLTQIGVAYKRAA